MSLLDYFSRFRVPFEESLKGSIRVAIRFLSGYHKSSSLNLGPFFGPQYSTK